MLKSKQSVVYLLAAFIFIMPLFSLADYGYLTMPVDPSLLSYSASNTGINAWVDHTSPQGLGGDNSSTMTRFDGRQFFGATAALATSTSNPTSTCTNFFGAAGCYNDHEGIDYAVTTGTPVLAAAAGTVRQAQWWNPADHTKDFGMFVRIWHSVYGVSTLYAHLSATTTLALASSSVARQQLIGYSGGTGDAAGAYHLHFQTYNADVSVSNTSTDHFSNSVDPYGWATTTYSDPWANDSPFGYMWASKFATSSVIHYVTSTFTMTANTTWLHDQIYVVTSTLTVSSSATLTIQQGVVVKCGTTGTCIDVQGKLNITGTSTDPVYITSLKDDSVGGDANDDATATTPAAGDWGGISFDAKSTTTIQNAVIRYGGANNSPLFTNVFVNGGYFLATSTTFASSSDHGLQVASGTAIIASSTFINNANDGFLIDGVGTLKITSSTFSGNPSQAAEVALQLGPSVTFSGNSASGNGDNGFITQGNMNASSTWSSAGTTVPYILNSVTIPLGTTLTVNSGTVMKSNASTLLSVRGTLNAQGSSSSLIYFTSLKDDSVGGDTNDDGNSTGTAGDWQDIYVDSSASATLKFAVIRYGGSGSPNIYGNGGRLTLNNTVVASSSGIGLHVVSGTISVVSSTFNNNVDKGIAVDTSGTLTLAGNTFMNNTDAVFLDLTGGVVLNPPSGDSATGTGERGFVVTGSLGANQTWSQDLPYITTGLTVPSGKTLTISSGTIVKFDSGGSLTVSGGTLNVQGTSTNKVYFTSLKDDSIGGDTNSDGTSTSAGLNDWLSIELDSGASATIQSAVVRYGGSGPGAIQQAGGTLTLIHTLVASSTIGIYGTSGTSTILSSEIAYNPNDGISMSGGTMVVSSTNIHNNGFGFNNSDGATSTATAIHNYWNASSGPTVASNPGGSGDQVSDHVSYNPFATSSFP